MGRGSQDAVHNIDKNRLISLRIQLSRASVIVSEIPNVVEEMWSECDSSIPLHHVIITDRGRRWHHSVSISDHICIQLWESKIFRKISTDSWKNTLELDPLSKFSLTETSADDTAQCNVKWDNEKCYESNEEARIQIKIGVSTDCIN